MLAKIYIFINKEIFILQYPNGDDLSFSDGKIISIDNNNIIHNCSALKGSSGSPIIYDLTILGLHYGSYNDKIDNNNSYNLFTSIISIINDLKKQYKVKNNIFYINNNNKINFTNYEDKETN